MAELPHTPHLPTFAGEDMDVQRASGYVRIWWRITQALENSVTPQRVIDTVIEEGVQALGADAGSIYLPHPDAASLEIKGTVGHDPSRLEGWHILPLNRHTLSTQAYLTREAVIIETAEQAVHDYPVLRGVLADSQGSFAALPLLVGRQALGVLTLTFRHRRLFDATDRSFLTTLASMCAQALQRSTALAEAQQLNLQLQFLADASALLSRSLDIDTILESIARLTIPHIADWCVIYLPKDNDQLEPVTIVHQDPQMVTYLREYIRRHRLHTNPDSAVQRVFKTGQAETLPVITDAMYDATVSDPDEREQLRHLQLRSLITVPLLAGGKTVGVLGLGRTDLERAYTAADVTFAAQIASRAGKAVENARLHRALQLELHEHIQTQRALDAANTHLEERVRERTAELQRLNDELQAFAHSASHDLRTPIRHIFSFSELLARQLPAGNSRAEQTLTRIQQGAKQLAATVDGLLLLSQGSQQDLNHHAVDLKEITAKMIDALSSQEEGRQITWQLADLPTVKGDRELLTLVMQNLLGNALKYTRHTERTIIEISFQRQAERTTVTVRDNGVGFGPEYAHKLFQPFQRLHSSAEFEGTGLGLANVRRIVQRHGGDVWATSTPGQGATFSFTLPD